MCHCSLHPSFDLYGMEDHEARIKTCNMVYFSQLHLPLSSSRHNKFLAAVNSCIHCSIFIHDFVSSSSKLGSKYGFLWNVQYSHLIFDVICLCIVSSDSPIQLVSFVDFCFVYFWSVVLYFSLGYVILVI